MDQAAALADQQLWTAWISATAAVVQAVGAIAAIGVAIYLARSSEARAAAAEAASARREEQAVAAAAERAAAADKAAEERAKRASQAEQAQLVRSVELLARELLDEVDHELSSAETNYATSDANIMGGYAPKRGPALAALIPEWKLRAREPGLLRALGYLEECIRPWKHENTLPGPLYCRAFRAYREKIATAIQSVTSFHPPSMPGSSPD